MTAKHDKSITVDAFFQAARHRLHLELVAGSDGLRRSILEGAINRPGLALSGFFAYFANRRIQVIGLAEYTYLASLSERERESRFREFFAKTVPCVVFTRNKRPFPALRRMAEEMHVPVFRTSMVTKHFVNAATLIMENLMAPRMTVQGTMVEIMGIGVMIDGKPGIGKSEAALSLIKRGYAIVSDDVTQLRLDSAGTIVGTSLPATRYHMEIRGLGIIHVPSLFGVASVRQEKVLDLVVTLRKPGVEDELDRSGENRGIRDFFGIKVPQIYIPVAPGRELANVIEAAALDQKLRFLGHDAEKELDQRLITLMGGGTHVSE